MSKRTQALSIPPRVKARVYARDGGKCVLCGKAGLPEAHYIPRSQGGIGTEENIVTLCRQCHDRLDNTTERKALMAVIRRYLTILYPDVTDDDRQYKKERI